MDSSVVARSVAMLLAPVKNEGIRVAERKVFLIILYVVPRPHFIPRHHQWQYNPSWLRCRWVIRGLEPFYNVKKKEQMTAKNIYLIYQVVGVRPVCDPLGGEFFKPGRARGFRGCIVALGSSPSPASRRNARATPIVLQPSIYILLARTTIVALPQQTRIHQFAKLRNHLKNNKLIHK